MPEDKPFIKNKTQQKLYNNLLSSNLDDILSEGLGLNNPLEAPARSFGQRDAYEELYPEQEFEDPSYTPGRKQGLGHEGKLTGDEVEQFKQLVQNSKNVPNIYVDVPDALAENQSVLDKWANGITKFVGKTATNVVGSTVGQVYGLFSAIGNGEFNKFYDNAFQRVLDDANTYMDEALPNYVRKETEEKSLFGQMGTANFWANDFLGGMSFVAGAVLSELATKGLSTPALIARATKLLKLGRVAKAADVASDAVGKGFKAFNVGQDFVQPSLDFARKTIVGAGYEAGVEARHFVDEAKTNYINSYTEQNGRPPSEVEVAAFMDEAHRVGNTVFGINLALVGGANAVTLPKSFGPGLLDRMGNVKNTIGSETLDNLGLLGRKAGMSAGADDAAKGVVKTSELSTKQLERIAAKTGQSVDEILKTPTINKALAYSTGEKIGRNTFNALKKPFVEGVWEEGMQGSINKGALDYVARTYDEDATNDTMNMGEALLQGMEETYGSSEGWKEIMVGMLIGSTGMVSPGKGGKGLGWQGNIFQELVKNDAKDARVNGLVNMINANPSMIPVLSNNWKAAKQQLVASRNTDKALEENDFFNAKNEQFKAFHSYVAAKVEAGMYDDIIDNDVAEIQKMPEDKFAEEFGYENLTSEELKERKQKVINSVKEQAKNTRDALNHAKRITKSDNWDLNHGLAYTIASIKNADKRESEMGKSFSEAFGNIYSEGQVNNIVALNNNLKDSKALYKELKGKKEALEKLNKKIISERSGKTSSEIMENGREQEILEKEIRLLQKDLYAQASLRKDIKGEKLSYTRDFDAFLQDLEIFEQVQRDIKNLGVDVKQDFSAEELLKDLTRLARQRQQTITEYNLLMTEEGQKDFKASIDNLKNLQAKNMLAEYWDKDLEELRKNVKDGTKVKDLVLQGLKIRGSSLRTANPISIKDDKLNENQINQLANNNPIFKEWLTFWNDKLENIDITSPLSNQLSNLRKNLKIKKDQLKDLQEKITEFENTEVVAEFVVYVNEVNSDIQELTSTIQKISLLKDNVIEAATIVYRPFYPGKIHLTTEEQKENASRIGLKDLDSNNYSIELVEDPDNKGGETTFAKTYEGEIVENPKVAVRYNFNGTNKYLSFKINGKEVGVLNDPNRIQFKNSDGTLRDFNGSVEDLQTLNPNFVETVDDIIQPSIKGQQYNSIYKQLKEILDPFYKDSNRKIIEGVDISKLFYVNTTSSYKKIEGERPNILEAIQNYNLSIIKYGETSPTTGTIIYHKSGALFLVDNGSITPITDIQEKEYYINKYVENHLPKLKSQFVAVPGADGKSLIKNEYVSMMANTTDGNPIMVTLSLPDAPFIEELNALVEKRNSIKESTWAGGTEQRDAELKKVNEELKSNFFLPISNFDGISISPQFTLSSNTFGISIGIKLNPAQEEEVKQAGVKIVKPGWFNTGIYLNDIKDSKGGKYRFDNGNYQVRIDGEWITLDNESLLEIINEEISKDIKLRNVLDIIDKELPVVNRFAKNVTINIDDLNDPNNIEELSSLNVVSEVFNNVSLVPKGVILNEKPKVKKKKDIEDKYKEGIEQILAGEHTNEQLDAFNKVLSELLNNSEYSLEARQFIKDSIEKIANKKTNEINEGLEEALDFMEKSSNKTPAINSLLMAKEAYIEERARLYSLERLPTEEEDKRITEINLRLSQIDTEINDLTGNGANNAFKISENNTQDVINYEQSLQRIAEMLPSEIISVQELGEIDSRIRNNGMTWGSFSNRVIKLSKKAGRGTDYHEAFHAVVRTFMSRKELIALYKEAEVRYGKPSIEQLDKLKSSSPYFTNLTNGQLGLLWLEEKMADEFASFSVKKEDSQKGIVGAVARFFDKLKKFLDWIVGNKANIDNLFENIYQGAYKNSEAVNDFNTFFGSDIDQVFKLIPKLDGSYLDSVQSNRLYNKLVKSLYDLKNTKGYLTNDDYGREIIKLGNKYDPRTGIYSTYIKTTQQYIQVKDVHDALISFNTDFINELKSRVNRLQFEEIESDINDNDNVDNDAPVEFGVKASVLLGGLGSTSKQLREYLSMMEIPFDEFNLGLSEEDLASGNFNVGVNSYKLYTSIEALLTNTPRHKMLQKLVNQAEYNSDTKAVTLNLFRDIALEIGVPFDNTLENAKQIANLPIVDLYKSSKHNLFISNFNKYKHTSITTLADPEVGKSRVIRTNTNDVQDRQFDNWSNNYYLVQRKLNPEAVVTNLNLIKDLLQDSKSIMKSDTIKRIYEAFNNIGINISPNYIRYVLAFRSNNLVQDNLLSLLDKEDISDEAKDNLLAAKETLDLFSDIEVFDVEDINEITNVIKAGNNPYETEEIGVEDGDNETTKDKGNIGRLKRMALGNSFFDENVGSTTVQNAEGEHQYTHLYPNYFATETISMQDSSRRNWIQITDEKQAKEALNQSLIEHGRILSPYLLDKYYQALKDNHLLQGKLLGIKLDSNTSDFIFNSFRVFLNDGLKNVKISEISDVVNDEIISTDHIDLFKGSDGTTYASLDKRGRFITNLNYFAPIESNKMKTVRKIGGNEVTFVPFIPLQIEGKSTQIAVSLPIGNYSGWRNDRIILNNIGLEAIKTYFKQEYDRIGKVAKEIEEISKGNKEISKVEGYNTGNNPRGLQFFNFKDLQNTSNNFDKILKAAQDNVPFETLERQFNITELLSDYTNNKYQELLEELSSSDTSLIERTKEGFKNRLLPGYYTGKDGVINDETLQNFLVNSLINNYSYQTLLFGDLALNFKNPVHFVKRMAGPNAAGPSTGQGESSIAIIPDIKKNGINTTDGQSYATLDWYRKNYLQGLGKNARFVSNYYDRIQKGYKLNSREIKDLQSYGALANPRKLTVFDTFFYGKTSTKILIRSEVSYIEPENRQYLDSLYDNLNEVVYKSPEYNAIINEIHEMWKPLPNMVILHDRLNKMEKEQVDLLFYESAVKTAIVDITEDGDFNKTQLSNNYIREQVVTDGIKDKIVHGTQLMQLISSEHKDNDEVIFNDKKVKLGELRKTYRKLLGERVFNGFTKMRKSLMDGNIPQYKYLLKSFETSITESSNDPNLIEFFRAAYNEANQPEYNLNLPLIENKFESMYLSYISKDTLAQKVPGHKLTLVSDAGNEVLIYKEKTITTEQFLKLSVEEKSNVTSRSLEFKLDTTKNAYYAECKISGQISSMLGLTTGDVIPEEFYEMLGVRIPSQEKGSMVYLKIVDVLPAETGNQIVMPKEVLDYSGADFDIDSEFTRTASSYRSKGQFKIFGNYYKGKTANQTLKAAFEEYLEDSKEDIRVKEFIKTSKQNPDYVIALNQKIALQAELSKLTENLKGFDLYFEQLYSATEEDENTLVEAVLLDIFNHYLENDAVKGSPEKFSSIEDAIQWYIFNKSKAKKELVSEVITKVKELSLKDQNLKAILKLTEKNAISSFGYTTDFEQFKSSKKEQVLDNKIAYLNGDLSNIRPLTKGETNNLLLNIEKVLVYNESNKDIATSPADRKLGQDLIDALYGENGIGLKDPTAINSTVSPTDIIKAADANSVGQENIGIAAIWNIVFQYLVNNNNGKGTSKINYSTKNVALRNYINSKLKDGFKSYEINGERINRINSTQITFAVDNANNQDAAYLNLTKDSLPASLIMSSMGIPFNEASLMVIQPTIKEITSGMKVISSEIKSSKEKYLTKSKIVEEVLQKYLKAPLEKIELSEENLKEALKYFEGLSTDLTEAQYNYIQLSSIITFDEARKDGEFLRNFSSILSLIKGSKTSFPEMSSITNSLEELGIELVQKLGTSGNSINHFDLKSLDPENKLKRPFDILEVIKSDPLLETNIKTFALIQSDAKYFFITETPVVKSVIKSLKLNFKDKKLDYKDQASKVKNELLSYLAIKAYKKSTGKQFEIDELFGTLKNPTELIKLFNKLRVDPGFSNNKFLRYLNIEVTKYTDSKYSSSPYYGKVLYKLVANSRAKKNPDYQRELIAGYKELVSSNNKEASEFAKQAFYYLVMKDNLLLKNKSFISQVEPVFMKNFSNSLTAAHSSLLEDDNYQDIFGVTKEQLINDFIETFSRNQTNVFNLLSTSAKIINIQNSKTDEELLNIYEAFADSEDIDTSDLERNDTKEYIKGLKKKLGFELSTQIKEENKPIFIDPITRVININVFNGISTENQGLAKRNFITLAGIGVFPIVPILKNGKLEARIGYPKFIRVDKQVYKLTNSEMSKTDKEAKITNSSGYAIGVKANYTPVDNVGTKEAMPYAFDITQHNTYKKVESEIDTKEAVDYFEQFNKKENKPVTKKEQPPLSNNNSLDFKSVKNFGKEGTPFTITVQNIPFKFNVKITDTPYGKSYVEFLGEVPKALLQKIGKKPTALLSIADTIVDNLVNFKEEELGEMIEMLKTYNFNPINIEDTEGIACGK